MRKSVLLAIVILVTMIWGTLLIADDEMCVPMGDITIKPLAEEAKRSEVTFPHPVHFSYSCDTCHHKWDNKKPIQGCTASGCHDLEMAPREKDGTPVSDPLLQMRYYKNAYHSACIGCHKAIKMNNQAMEASKTSLGEKLPPAGPTSCKKCHPKE